MLQVLNKTDFETHVGLFTDQHGEDHAVAVIKGTFKIPKDPSDALVLADEQVPILLGDEYFGEPGKSSIKYPGDVILGKKTTDVGLVGHAYSKDDIPVTELSVGIAVGALQKTILVIGDRYWEKRNLLPGYIPSAPKPFTKMPIVYERAFGGVDDSHEDETKHEYCKENPIGSSFRVKKKSIENGALPNLEHHEQLITHWKDKPPVMGLGFIDSSWEPRIQYAGTYDEEWKNNHSPLLPVDFKIDFFNVASRGLQSPQFLQGGEPVELTNLSPKGALIFNLPQIKINTGFQYGDTHKAKEAQLWTVLFEPDDERFYVVWGQSLAIGKQPSKMRSVTVEIDGESPFSREDACSE